MGGRLTISLDFPDDAPILEVHDLAKSNRLIKVVDSAIFSKSSDPVEFGRMLQSLWAADEVQFTSPYVPATSFDLPAVVYTVPRTGTHVAMEVHGINKFLHVGQWPTMDHPLLVTLLRSQYIVGIARKNLIDTICSKEISKITPGVMLTTGSPGRLKSNTDIVKGLTPIAVDTQRLGDYLEEMSHYYSQLIALKIMFSKHMSFCLLDDLAVRQDLNMIKNPYCHEDLIVNYREVHDLVNIKYQPAYEYMTNQVITHCGLALSGVQYPSINNFRQSSS